MRYKFRVWDKPTGKILEVAEIDFQSMELLVVDHEGQEFREAVRGYYELMQFTGLTDKYGREIYEGDIVKIGSMFQENVKKRIGQVVFERGKYIIYENDFYKYELDSMGMTIEVIGNIYQHSHLLKENEKC